MTGIAVSMLGVTAIVTRGDPAALTGLTFNPGDIWALVSVAVVSLYNVLLPRRPQGLGPMSFLTVTALMALALLLPFYLWEAATGPTMGLSAGTVILALYMGLVPSVLAYAFWIPAVAALGANRVGIFSHLHPFFTTVLAILILGEALMPYHAAGIALILSGIWLATARRLLPRRLAFRRVPAPAATAVEGAGPSPRQTDQVKRWRRH
jgi:drug/metabolite transporter (DMT)-like permease